MNTTKDWLEHTLYDGINGNQMDYYVSQIEDTCPSVKRAYKRYQNAGQDLELIIKGELSTRDGDRQTP